MGSLRSAIRRAPGPVANEEGSALTEFALVAPLFILLMYWSTFFADVSLVRLKADEAARYSVWEMVAQRPPVTVQQEVRERFANLASPRAINRTRPVGVRSFDSVQIDQVNIDDRVTVGFGGQVQLPGSGAGGLLGTIMGGIQRFLNRAVNGLINTMRLNLAGAAEANVQFSVRNNLFPSGEVFNIFFDSGIDPRVTVRSRSPMLLVDTWKAWPGKYRTDTRLETNPYETYPEIGRRDSPPERLVSAQLRRTAFFGGVRGAEGLVGSIMRFLGFPSPIAMGTWRERQGPVVMLPGAPPKHGFVPGYGITGSQVQRIGNTWWARDVGMATVDSPEPGLTDRSRYTVPYRVNSELWRASGGNSRIRHGFTRANNPYDWAMQCRDAYYMGMSRSGTNAFENPLYSFQAYPSCARF